MANRILTEGQKDIIRLRYPTMTSDEMRALCAHWGIAKSTMTNIASRMGLVRDAEVRGQNCSAGQLRIVHARREEEPNPWAGVLHMGDDKYVRACIEQGGFVRAEVIDGMTVWVRPRLEMVAA